MPLILFKGHDFPVIYHYHVDLTFCSSICSSNCLTSAGEADCVSRIFSVSDSQSSKCCIEVHHCKQASST